MITSELSRLTRKETGLTFFPCTTQLTQEQTALVYLPQADGSGSLAAEVYYIWLPADTEIADTEIADTETADTETADTETAASETADTETADTETADTETADIETADTATADIVSADSAMANTEAVISAKPVFRGNEIVRLWISCHPLFVKDVWMALDMVFELNIQQG